MAVNNKSIDVLTQEVERLENLVAHYKTNVELIGYLCRKYKSSPFEALDAVNKVVEDLKGGTKNGRTA